MTTFAIIGAGISGLAAARVLQDAEQDVTLFEKNRAVGGRAATRKHRGFIYDHGAQYIKPEHAITSTWISERFTSPDLVDIAKPVWTFHQMGQIQPGDPKQNAGPKWSYRYGLVTLPKLIAEELTVQAETLVIRLVQTQAGWEVYGEKDTLLGTYEQVLITLPLPLASELLENSTLDTDLKEQTISRLKQGSYRPLLSVTLGYRFPLRKRPYYALVNIDKKHPISWLAWEHEKSPRRIPPKTGMLIAQMAPGYSRDHWETPAEEVFSDVGQQIAVLLAEKFSEPVFTNLQRWRYALPDQKVDASELNDLTRPAGLTFCGDGFVGGRVSLALEHGIAVAQELLASSNRTTYPPQ